MIRALASCPQGRLEDDGALSGSFGLADAGEAVDALRHAFRVDRRWFLVPQGLPAELVLAMRCSGLPFAPAWCLGLANFHGEPVPVYDLGVLFGQGDRRREGGQFLVLGSPGSRAGLRIDEIAVLSVPPDTRPEPLAPLPGLPSELPCAGSTIGGTTYIETDLIASLGALAQAASAV